MRTFARILFFFCFGMSVLAAGARDVVWTELPTQGQLPVANIHRLLQDGEGYMWYGTEGGGLCRDDGYDVDVFRSGRPHAAPAGEQFRDLLGGGRAGAHIYRYDRRTLRAG